MSEQRRVDKTLVFVILAVTFGLALVVRGLLVSTTGEDRSDLPPFIEQVDPVPEAVQVLNQSNVFVDLAPGFTGVLIIDGVEIETVTLGDLVPENVEPGQQIQVPPVTVYEPGNATLTFTPNASAPISEFVDGEHSAEVVYWRIEETRQQARSFTWVFNVV